MRTEWGNPNIHVVGIEFPKDAYRLDVKIAMMESVSPKHKYIMWLDCDHVWAQADCMEDMLTSGYPQFNETRTIAMGSGREGKFVTKHLYLEDFKHYKTQETHLSFQQALHLGTFVIHRDFSAKTMELWHDNTVKGCPKDHDGWCDQRDNMVLMRTWLDNPEVIFPFEAPMKFKDHMWGPDKHSCYNHITFRGRCSPLVEPFLDSLCLDSLKPPLSKAYCNILPEKDRVAYVQACRASNGSFPKWAYESPFLKNSKFTTEPRHHRRHRHHFAPSQS
ncbi:hypothetical protein CYMTET_39786 [Cymbomonas tetramitiformis]|uniref:Uncharacterized protein n=1 Tax=Cymbomonas tetramitiformis TaxID=36881 RepID=A0AAE0C9F0_9CHLO|nr:hypothetical protein CYMTET_39786 [Cymbomonas tetramitiformis]